MLPKSSRLKRDADFSRVYRKGFRVHSKNFVLTASGNSLSYPRFACVVPKTVSKKAVTRNLIRRHVHEAIAALLSQDVELSSLPLDVVISAKKSAEKTTLQTLQSEFKLALRTVKTKGSFRKS